MSVGGRFNSTDCMPVTGKDGKTVWIFKPEDLREVVPNDVYECIEAFLGISAEEKTEAWLKDREKVAELVEDGYLQMCLNARNDIEEVIKILDTTPRVTKKVIEEIKRKLKYVYHGLNENL